MLIAEGHGWPAGNLILRQKACSSIIPDGWRSHFRTLANKDGAFLRILTWRPARRRLESWLTVILSWILARTRKRRSRRATNSTFGSRHFAWTRGCSTNLTVRRPTRGKRSQNPSRLRSLRLPPNLRVRRQRVPRQKRRANRASRLRRNQRQRPTEKSACWSGSIFLRTRSFPSSAGSIAFRPRSLSRALRRKSSITAIRNLNRRTGNSSLWSDLTEARVWWIRAFEAKLAAKFRAFGLARTALLN